MAKIKICMDAGHYGKYNRSPSVPAYYESECMWKLQGLLKSALEGFGIDVITTRTDPAKDLALFKRGYAAAGCDLFISLHSNAADRTTADYVSVYYLTPDTGTDVDEKSKEIAGKLAPVVSGVMGVKEKSQILYNKAKTDKNKDGMINDNAFGVLNGARQANVPGVLIEHSFHTNPDAAKWLLNENNLDILATAEAKAIAQYFGIVKEENKQEGIKMLDMKLPVLKKGNKSESVKALQTLLIGYGYSVGSSGVDGSFGGATERALKAYQKDNGLEQDGSCGRKSWTKLLKL